MYLPCISGKLISIYVGMHPISAEHASTQERFVPILISGQSGHNKVAESIVSQLDRAVTVSVTVHL